jgi:hypothetical protein
MQMVGIHIAVAFGSAFFPVASKGMDSAKKAVRAQTILSLTIGSEVATRQLKNFQLVVRTTGHAIEVNRRGKQTWWQSEGTFARPPSAFPTKSTAGTERGD